MRLVGPASQKELGPSRPGSLASDAPCVPAYLNIAFTAPQLVSSTGVAVHPTPHAPMSPHAGL